MILNIQETYNRIEQDIITNQKDIFNLYNLYNRKYSHLSDRINDVCTALLLDDSLRPVVQIFIRNRNGYIRSRIIFNKDGNKIINTEILNYKINE